MSEAAAASAYDVEFVRITKAFGATVAVDDVDLQVRSGEFLSLLGPSGCGKTTSLRMIAGFEQPTSGRLEIGGRDAAGVPPYRRDVNTVFQQYALFPHLTVLDNVAYGLKQRGVERAERRKQAEAALALVQMQGLGARKPRELSGGQQQRVALARALVMRPRVLLLDEPLGALDLKLRKQMQIELKALQQEVGITFIYVTHDQEEALAMSDRIAVMARGRIEQIDEPLVIYDRPATAFVADFIGDMNLLRGRVAESAGGEFVLEIDGGSVRGRGEAAAGTQVLLGLRPEKISVEASSETGTNRLPGRLLAAMALGDQLQIVVELASGERIIAREQRAAASALASAGPGADVVVCFPVEAPLVLPEDAAEGGA